MPIRIFVDCSHGLCLLLSVGLAGMLLSWFLLNPKHTLLLLNRYFWQRRLLFDSFWVFYRIWFYVAISIILRCWGVLLMNFGEKLDELVNWLWTFRIQIFTFLHIAHLMMKFDDETDELFFVCGIALIELDDALLQNVEEWVDAVIVCFFLKAGCKAWINRHLINKIQKMKNFLIGLL